MNREELHDTLDELAGPDETPTHEMLAAFRRKATRARLIRRTTTIACATLAVVVVLGAVAIAREGPSPKVVTPSNTTPPSTAPSLPPTTSEPSTVSVIGDGVMLGAQTQLQEALSIAIPGTTVSFDAAESTQFADAVAQIEAQRSSGRLGDTVVIHLGTNGTIRDSDFDRVMSALDGVPRVVIVNVKVPRPWEQQVNEALAAGVARYPVASLLDWHAYASEHPEFFYDDGIHLRPEAATPFAEFVATSVMAQPQQVTAEQDRVRKAIMQEQIPVVDHNGDVRGTVKRTDLYGANGQAVAQVILAEVHDTEGRLVGYYGNVTGFLERSVVEVPGFDLLTYAREHDMLPPGFASDDAQRNAP